MEKMRAILFHQHGDTRQLEYTYIQRPVPGPNEVLIKVGACALNHLDIWTLHGMAGVKIPLPHVLGCDISGTVVRTGRNVKKLRKDQRVVVNPGIVMHPASEYARQGWDSLSEGFKIIGFLTDGGYAEYVKVPRENVIPVSKKYTFQEWAAAPLVFLTAWHMLVTRAELKKNEWVLIHAAGSGVGSAAIQLAKHIGAKVITTVGKDAKIKKAKALGADYVIPYHKKDFSEEIRRITKNRGVDVVLEHIGPATFEKSLLSLKKRGRLVTCGVTSGALVQINLRHVFFNQLSIIGCYMGGAGELKKVLQLLEKGKLKPVVDKVYPLREAREALRRMESRQNFGKIILVP